MVPLFVANLPANVHTAITAGFDPESIITISESLNYEKCCGITATSTAGVFVFSGDNPSQTARNLRYSGFVGAIVCILRPGYVQDLVRLETSFLNARGDRVLLGPVSADDESHLLALVKHFLWRERVRLIPTIQILGKEVALMSDGIIVDERHFNLMPASMSLLRQLSATSSRIPRERLEEALGVSCGTLRAQMSRLRRELTMAGLEGAIESRWRCGYELVRQPPNESI